MTSASVLCANLSELMRHCNLVCTVLNNRRARREICDPFSSSAIGTRIRQVKLEMSRDRVAKERVEFIIRGISETH